MMPSIKKCITLTILSFFLGQALASQCCGRMGGIRYCDSSAGRFVCNNGFYSVCYCTPHAVMDLQKIQGCCLWQGGVLSENDGSGLVVCNNGAVSEVCSIQSGQKSSGVW